MVDWLRPEIKAYVDGFTDVRRTAVLEKIMANALLSEFLETSSGRLIMDEVTMSINREIGTMLDLAIEHGPDMVRGIEGAALRINVAYDFMKRLADIYVNGEVHMENIRRAEAEGGKVGR